MINLQDDEMPDFETYECYSEDCDEIHEKYQTVKKCYMYDCPKCGASTGFGGFYPIAESTYMTCDSCGYENESEEFLLITYYENDLEIENTPILKSDENVEYKFKPKNEYGGVKRERLTENKKVSNSDTKDGDKNGLL